MESSKNAPEGSFLSKLINLKKVLLNRNEKGLGEAYSEVLKELTKRDERYGQDEQQDAFELITDLLSILDEELTGAEDGKSSQKAENDKESTEKLPEELVRSCFLYCKMVA